jgi:glycosyltransferase involved in cell wall biosynthesis
MEIRVVEIGSRQSKYPWTRPARGNYEKQTLFTEITTEDLSSIEVTARLLKTIWESGAQTVVVSGYSHPWDIAAAALARATGRLALSVFDSTEIDRERNPRKERLKGLAVRHLYDGVFCSGKRSREYLRKLGVKDERIQEGYDVVDNDHFAAPREPSNPALPDCPYFLSVTRFSPEKNLLAMLDAYEAYCRRPIPQPLPCEGRGGGHPLSVSERGRGGALGEDGGRVPAPWPLVMCGSGPQDAEVRARAARITAGKVIFPGFLGYDALPEVYQRAGCMLLPSLSEPWGLVVNEAMAAGTPVIVSDRCGCAPDLVEHGKNGFVFDPLDPGALADLMTRMASMPKDERRAMGKRGQEIIAGYTPETWARNFMELVERCRVKEKEKSLVRK